MYFVNHCEKLPSSVGKDDKAITNIPNIDKTIKKKLLIMFNIINAKSATILRNVLMISWITTAIPFVISAPKDFKEPINESSSASITGYNLLNSFSYSALDEKSSLKAMYIPTDANIIQGDSIETSGLGGIYPKGIHIGTVKKVTNTQNMTDRYALVETAVDFDKLDTVLVITNK